MENVLCMVLYRAFLKLVLDSTRSSSCIVEKDGSLVKGFFGEKGGSV